MSTEAQIQANRLNAQKSTGPRTPEGKTVASQNSVKHGLTAVSDVICSESQADFDIQSQEILDELNPITPLEYVLAERIVSLSWRLKRAVRFQKQAIDILKFEQDQEQDDPYDDDLCSVEASAGVPSYEDVALGYLTLKDFSNQRVLEHLLMYERRIENSLYKTIREFQRLKLAGKSNTESKTPAYQPISFNPYTNAANINKSSLQNEPNFQNAKNDINPAFTIPNNNEPRTTNLVKQTQPVLSAVEVPIELSRAFGPEPCRRGKSMDLLRATSHERLTTDCRSESLE